MTQRPSLSKRWRILLVGDCGVGKSTFFYSKVKDQDETDIMSTIGVDFHTRTLLRKSQEYKLQVWDTAGRRAFRSVTLSYFPGTDAFLLFFDISSRASLASCDEWIHDIRSKVGESVPIFLIGNKTDLTNEVSMTDIDRVCETHGIDEGALFQISLRREEGGQILDRLLDRLRGPVGQMKEDWPEPATESKPRLTWGQWLRSWMGYE